MQYEIKGSPLPVVICNVDAGESIVTEKGGMSWMTTNMSMSTNAGGSFGKAMSRMFSGESIFQNIYTAQGGPGQIAFASSFPGTIKAIELEPGKNIIVQKSAFLAAEPTVELSIHFQKKIGKGLFGGEGFIMQKLSGSGTAFIEISGAAIEYELAAGQQLTVGTGHLVAMDDTCTMDIEMVKGAKNVLLGGEGLFNTVVKGPGKVTLQTMPLINVANMLIPFMVDKN